MSEKRMEIIESTALLMQSKGYENTKLSDILEVSKIGKGQFYYYFSSKYELGLAVVDYYFANFNQELLVNILSAKESPEIRFNEMLHWVVETHRSNEAKCGCVFGNFAIEMSEHDEVFRQKINSSFDLWIQKLKLVLEEMINFTASKDVFEVNKLAQGIVGMLEGGILIMKNKQDIRVLEDMAELAKALVKTFVKSYSDKKDE